MAQDDDYLMEDGNEHLLQKSFCPDCHWIGVSGELLLKGGLDCPQCGGGRCYVVHAMGKEAYENMRAAFVEHDIPWPYLN